MRRKCFEIEPVEEGGIVEVINFERLKSLYINFSFIEFSTSIDESNKILDDDDILSLADDQSSHSNRSRDSPSDKFVNLNSASKC